MFFFFPYSRRWLFVSTWVFHTDHGILEDTKRGWNLYSLLEEKSKLKGLLLALERKTLV